tara:strand:- start:2 stop:328 length:327 start_codon:yes stop_codon:yes gene_type:complete
MNCVNRNLPEFKELQGLSGTNEFILAAKISVWQDQNGLESFPTIEDLGLARQPINEVDEVDSFIGTDKSLLSGNVDTENDFISGKDLSLDNKLDWRTEDNDSEDPFMC